MRMLWNGFRTSTELAVLEARLEWCVKRATCMCTHSFDWLGERISVLVQKKWHSQIQVTYMYMYMRK